MRPELFTLHTVFDPVRARWRLAVFMLAICVAAAVAAVLLQTPKYSSSTQLFVSTPASEQAADAIANAYQGGEFTTARVQSYIELKSSNEILQPVISDLGLKMTIEELASEITVSAPANTVLINLQVTDSNARRAQRIATELAAQYIRIIERLESSPGQTAPVQVRVSSAATYSPSKVSPHDALDVGFGILAGLLLAFALTHLLDRLDDSLKSDADVTATSQLQVLAHIPRDPTAREGGRSLEFDSANGRLEALRTIRTALKYVAVDDPPRCILITSCEPAAGKSATASALAAVIADGGQSVAIVDADLRRPRLNVYFDVSQGDTSGLTDVVSGAVAVDDALVSIERPKAPPGSSRLMFLPAGTPIPNPSELLGSHKMRLVVQDLRARFDVVLIDSPPLIPVTDAAVVAALSDGVLFVLEYGRTSKSDLARSLRTLQQVDADILGVVANKVAPRRRYGYMYGYDDYRVSHLREPDHQPHASSTTDDDR